MQKYKSNITTTSGAALRNVPVEVIAENGTQAVLFLDREGTVPAANPLRTGADGTFYFYAVNGRYSLQTTVEGATITDRDVVLLMDPEEITVAGPIAEAVAAAEAAATRAEEAVRTSGIPALVEAAQNSVVDANTNAGIATTKAGEAAASAGAAQTHSDTALGYKNEANASKIAAAGSAAADATSATNAGDSANAAAASAASIAGGPVASWNGLTGIITQSQVYTTVRSAVLTGLSTATSTAVEATDSLIEAIGKLVAGLTLKANLSGAAFTGDVHINKVLPTLGLSRTTDTALAGVSLLDAGVLRWRAGMETGAGAPYFIARYNDAGAYVDIPFSINRSSGIANFTYTPTAPTATAGDNSAKLATTAHVKSQFNSGELTINGTSFRNLMTSGDYGTAINLQVPGAQYVDWAGALAKPVIETHRSPGDTAIWWLRHVAPGDAYTAAIGCIGQSVGANIRLQLPGAYFDFTTGGAALKPGGGSWSDTSDARTKENIQAWDTGLSAIMQLKVRRWNFRKETGRDVDQEFVGLVAQEAELVAPRLVSKRAGELGSLKFDDLRAVDPSDLVYMLVNGMQEQQRTIEGLQVRIAALESKQ